MLCISQTSKIKDKTGRFVSAKKNVILICQDQYSAKVTLGNGEGHLNIVLEISILFTVSEIDYIRGGEKKSVRSVSGYFASGRRIS